MSTYVKPWGQIDWLMPKIGKKRWHFITSASFEERCLATARWIKFKNYEVESSSIFHITNPPSDLWESGEPIVLQRLVELQQLLAACSATTFPIELLSYPTSAMTASPLGGNEADSVILDITTLPKRFFLYAIKNLLREKKVKNLIVTYARALRYTESALCEDALPPESLQGYARTEAPRTDRRMIVGVGYVPLSVQGLLEQAKHIKLDFVFPFPPASPAFRRNWTLLALLMPATIPRNTEIHRINGMDAFEVYSRVMAWGEKTDLDLLPLGPKPHAMGMALACINLGGHSEMIYSQPRAYRHDYSEGIATDAAGNPKIIAYCLKYDGKQMF